METVHLLRAPTNAVRLLESIQQANSGELVEHELMKPEKPKNINAVNPRDGYFKWTCELAYDRFFEARCANEDTEKLFAMIWRQRDPCFDEREI